MTTHRRWNQVGLGPIIWLFTLVGVTLAFARTACWIGPPLPKPPELVPVLTAKKPIASGERITSEMIETKHFLRPNVPYYALGEDFFSTLKDPEAQFKILPGQVIVMEMIDRGRQFLPTYDPISIPQGIRVIAIQAVVKSEHLEPGDRVSIFGVPIDGTDESDLDTVMEELQLFSINHKSIEHETEKGTLLQTVSVLVKPDQVDVMIAAKKKDGYRYLIVQKVADR